MAMIAYYTHAGRKESERGNRRRHNRHAVCFALQNVKNENEPRIKGHSTDGYKSSLSLVSLCSFICATI